MPSPPRSRSAFTLVELLVVMGIIVLMAGIGLSALRGGSNGDGTRGAAETAASLFTLARTEAIMSRVKTRVVVDTNYNSAQKDNYLRRLIVVGQKRDPATGAVLSPDVWVPLSKWTVLPGNNFVDNRVSPQEMSVFHGNGTKMVLTNLVVGSGAPSSAVYSYYEFTPTGQANNTGTALPRLLISLGEVRDGKFIARDANLGDFSTHYGFVLQRMGRPTFFKDNKAIKEVVL